MSDEALTLSQLAAHHARQGSDLVGLADLSDGLTRAQLIDHATAHALVSTALSAAAEAQPTSRTVVL